MTPLLLNRRPQQEIARLLRQAGPRVRRTRTTPSSVSSGLFDRPRRYALETTHRRLRCRIVTARPPGSPTTSASGSYRIDNRQADRRRSCSFAWTRRCDRPSGAHRGALV